MKNKIINITLLVLLGGFILFRVNTALNQMDNEEQTAGPQPEIPSTFYGTIPCADCPGIEYLLHLDENRYTEFRWYIDRDSTPSEQTGTWEQRSDTLFLYDSTDQNYQAFLMDEDRLTLLNREQNRVTGDLAAHYILQRLHEATSIRRQYEKLSRNDVEFVATGNEPFWNIQIYDDGKFVFTTPESEHRFDEFEFTENDGFTEYSAGDQSVSVKITAEPELCRDSMSGYIFTHAVSVSSNQDLSAQGCGQFLR